MARERVRFALCDTADGIVVEIAESVNQPGTGLKWVEVPESLDAVSDEDLSINFQLDGNVLTRVAEEDLTTSVDIKDFAAHVIDTHVPVYKQLNHMRRLEELRGKPGKMSVAERREAERIEKDFEWIDKVRERSTELEVNPNQHLLVEDRWPHYD